MPLCICEGASGLPLLALLALWRVLLLCATYVTHSFEDEEVFVDKTLF